MRVQVRLFIPAMVVKMLQSLLRVLERVLGILVSTWLIDRITVPRPSLVTPPIRFTIPAPRSTMRIPIAIAVTMSSFTLRHGTALDRVLPRPTAPTPSQTQGPVTSRKSRTPSVTGNFTTLLARSILMVGSTTWWSGFRLWYEALYYGRRRRSPSSAGLKHGAKTRRGRGRWEASSDRVRQETQMRHKGNVGTPKGSLRVSHDKRQLRITISASGLAIGCCQPGYCSKPPLHRPLIVPTLRTSLQTRTVKDGVMTT
jgi:hypothetical protein